MNELINQSADHDGERRQPSASTVAYCQEIVAGRRVIVDCETRSEAVHFSPENVGYLARHIFNNQTVQTIALPVDALQQQQQQQEDEDDNDTTVLENFLFFLEHNWKLRTVKLVSNTPSAVSRNIMKKLAAAISKNPAIETLKVSDVHVEHFPRQDHWFDLRQSSVKNVYVTDSDDTSTEYIFTSLGTSVQRVELNALPSLERNVGRRVQYGTPLHPETIRALSHFVSHSESLQRLAIRGYPGAMFETLANGISANNTIQELSFNCPILLEPASFSFLESILRHCSSCKSLTLCGRMLTSERLLMLGNTIPAMPSLTRLMISIDEVELHPDFLSNLLPPEGTLTSLSLSRMPLSNIYPRILQDVGHGNLTSLSLGHCRMTNDQVAAVLQSAANGPLSSLESLELSAVERLSRETLDCARSALITNAQLSELRLECIDRINSTWYRLSFDDSRQCRLIILRHDMPDTEWDILIDWLAGVAVNGTIALTNLEVQAAKDRTVTYISQKVFPRFPTLTKFSMSWLSFSSMAPGETSKIFLAALEQNYSLKDVRLVAPHGDIVRHVYFIVQRNRLHELLQADAATPAGLWPWILGMLAKEEEDRRSGLFWGIREGLGRFWLPDETER